MDKLQITGFSLAILIVLTLLGGLFTRVAFYTFVDNYEFAYMFDARNGETYPLVNKDGTYKQGYIFSYPIVQHVHIFDTRPIQICIEGGPTASRRVLNCKLVSFDPKGLETFIEWHGRGDYDPHNLKNILMVYAYDPAETSYPFLNISKDGKHTFGQKIDDKTILE
jgi:hypothetical protein